jgi:glycosyltransferase involved in cell wall biosynthesis
VGAVNTLYWYANDWGMERAVEEELQLATTEERRAAIRAELVGWDSAGAEADLALCDLVLVESPRIGAVLSAHGVPAERITSILQPVALDRFRPVDRTGRQGPLRVLYVGRAGYTKGVHYAARAVRALGPGVAEMTAVGPDLVTGREMRRSHPWVRFAGEVRWAEVPRWHDWADVLVLPTLSEAMARVVSEAMGSGLPVITTEESGYVGVAEPGVEFVLVPTRDEGALAAAILELAGDPGKRERIGRAARARAEALSPEAHRRRIDDWIENRLRPALAASRRGQMLAGGAAPG